MFEIKKRDGLARIGILELPHGRVETPALMPVINPGIELISAEEMEGMGAQMFITNSYIIMNSHEFRERAVEEGIHTVAGTKRPVMTDSGAFQGHMYGRVRTDNMEVLSFQRDIGVDIATILDVFSEPHFTFEEARHSVEETYRRGKEACENFPDINLAGPVQGGIYGELRAESARHMSSLPFAIHPIGGVVPLMEDYRYAELVDVILSSKKGLNLSRPVHLFGAGHPMLFPLAALLGCDLFDSSSYAKYAYDNRMMFPWGTEKLENMEEFLCSCPVCSSHTPEELRKMPADERHRLLAMHNLYVSFTELKKVREAIRKGRLWEMVEQRVRVRPELLDALRKIPEHGDYIERFEPRTRRSTFLYSGAEGLLRPGIRRASEDAERIAMKRPRKLLPFDGHPYSLTNPEILEKERKLLAVNSPFGPIPVELDSTYPFGQSIFPKKLDREIEERMREMEYAAPEDVPEFDYDKDIERVRAIAEYQFGEEGAELLLDGKISLVKSKNTGRIRNVFVDGEHVLSLRAEDGLYTLKIAGGKRLMKTEYPGYRTVISEGDEFVRDGKNVFAAFVIEMDERLRPYDECVVVNKKDELLAVGRAILNREEALSFKRGIAVRVREGNKGQEKEDGV